MQNENGQIEIFEFNVRDKVSLMRSLMTEGYALRKGGVLIPISENSYKNELSSLEIGHQNMSEIIEETEFELNSLKRTIMYMNSDGLYFPSTKSGISAGVSMQHIPGIHAGIFVEIPLKPYSKAMLQIGFNYQLNSFSSLQSTTNFFSVDRRNAISSISIPIGVKHYTKIHGENGNKRRFSLFGISYNSYLSDYGELTVPTSTEPSSFRLETFTGIYGGYGFERVGKNNRLYGMDFKLRFLYSLKDVGGNFKTKLNPNLRVNIFTTF